MEVSEGALDRIPVLFSLVRGGMTKGKHKRFGMRIRTHILPVM